MKVKVFEKVKKYEPFGGPIQLQCNAQGALDSIDPVMAEEVMEKNHHRRPRQVAGWREREWFYRFDTRKPCHENGLPLTLVLSRFELLDILSRGVGEENIEMGTVVEKYEHRRDKVVATLTDGREFTGDVLIGADGIRSKLRAQMRGSDPENPPLAYAGYAVYTGGVQVLQPHREPKHTDPNKVGYKYSSDRSNTSSLRTSETENNSITPSWRCPRVVTMSLPSAKSGKTIAKCSSTASKAGPRL